MRCKGQRFLILLCSEKVDFLNKERKRRISATEDTEILFYKEKKRRILATEDTEILFYKEKKRFF